jgi:hypothetical protein
MEICFHRLQSALRTWFGVTEEWQRELGHHLATESSGTSLFAGSFTYVPHLIGL